MEVDPSPIVKLNRAVAVAMVKGSGEGMRALQEIADHPALRSYYLLPATFADFYLQMNQKEIAADYYRKTLALVGTAPERDFLQRKLRQCEK